MWTKFRFLQDDKILKTDSGYGLQPVSKGEKKNILKGISMVPNKFSGLCTLITLGELYLNAPSSRPRRGIMGVDKSKLRS